MNELPSKMTLIATGRYTRYQQIKLLAKNAKPKPLKSHNIADKATIAVYSEACLVSVAKTFTMHNDNCSRINNSTNVGLFSL